MWTFKRDTAAGQKRRLYRISVCIYVYIYIITCMYIYTHTHTDTHKHTHTHSLSLSHTEEDDVVEGFLVKFSKVSIQWLCCTNILGLRLQRISTRQNLLKSQLSWYICAAKPHTDFRELLPSNISKFIFFLEIFWEFSPSNISKFMPRCSFADLSREVPARDLYTCVCIYIHIVCMYER